MVKNGRAYLEFTEFSLPISSSFSLDLADDLAVNGKEWQGVLGICRILFTDKFFVFS
jgi:hypothetical protein